MKLPASLGVVETNSIDYVRTLFKALREQQVVAPLRSHDDEQRKQVANVADVISPAQVSGWCNETLTLSPTNDVAHISFTSGTEGLPKGVLLSSQALVDVVQRVQLLMEMTEEAREYIGVPVYHSFGYGRCRHVASVGGQFYVPANGFDPREVADMLSSGAINALSLVPSLLRVFIHNPSIIDEVSYQLRWLEIGSQAMTADEKIAVRELFPNARIVQHYGLTEASRATLLSIDKAEPSVLASVGKAYGDSEIRINEQQRICIRGRHVANGILKEGQLTNLTDDEGWFETTDLGRIEDGYLYFNGRADNVVNCGGQKCSTDTLELAIADQLEHSIQEFAVSKIPHAVYGEGFLLSYTSSVDEQLLKSLAVTALSEAGIKAKNALMLHIVDQIPKTHTGKIQHKVLSDSYLTLQANQENISVGSNMQQAFIDVLGIKSSELSENDSASDIGFDSIQSVQLSIKIEGILGYLPPDWRSLSILDLDVLPVKSPTKKARLVSKGGKAPPIWDGSSNRNPEGIGFWALIKEDYKTHDSDFFSQGFFAIFVNRFGNWRMGIKRKFFRAPMTIVYRLLKKMAQIFCGIKLDYTVHVGRRVKLEHFGGMILGARSIGDDTIIRQNTTFGIRDMTDLSAKPIIENGVNIGAGVVIVGDIVVGRHSVIGPNCVITEDVPPFSIVSSAANTIKALD